jgi:hypothetical protein
METPAVRVPTRRFLITIFQLLLFAEDQPGADPYDDNAQKYLWENGNDIGKQICDFRPQQGIKSGNQLAENQVNPEEQKQDPAVKAAAPGELPVHLGKAFRFEKIVVFQFGKLLIVGPRDIDAVKEGIKPQYGQHIQKGTYPEPGGKKNNQEKQGHQRNAAFHEAHEHMTRAGEKGKKNG